jgi:hypothetical protein
VSKNTNGQFSYHLVKIVPNKTIGKHVHKEQLETHEVIAGSGICVSNGVQLKYAQELSLYFLRICRMRFMPELTGYISSQNSSLP